MQAADEGGARHQAAERPSLLHRTPLLHVQRNARRSCTNTLATFRNQHGNTYHIAGRATVSATPTGRNSLWARPIPTQSSQMENIGMYILYCCNRL